MRYYYVLGVSPDATLEEINIAYKTLSEKYLSVDFQINKDFADNKLNELNEAYSVLSDINQRNLYNLNNNSDLNYSLNSLYIKPKSKLLVLFIAIAIVIISLIFLTTLLFKNIKNNINTVNSSINSFSSSINSDINSSISSSINLSSSVSSISNSQSATKASTKTQSKPTSSTSTNKNYGNPAPNGSIPDEDLYCYNLLSTSEKEVYAAVLNAINNFSLETTDLSSYMIPFNGDASVKIIEFVLYDNPQIFWIDLTKGFSRVSDNSSATILGKYIFKDNDQKSNYIYNKTQVLDMKTTLDNNIEQVKSMLTSQMSEYQKTKIVHDWIVKKTVYDTTAPNAHNIYGAMVDGRAVCEGYAKALQFLLYKVGIQCLYVTGVGTNTDNQTENHAWNIAKVEGNWYQLDATWDDPAVIQSLTDFSYDYFLITDIEILRNHTLNNDYYKPPSCISSQFNYYTVEQLIYSTYDKDVRSNLINSLTEVCRVQGLHFYFKFTNKTSYDLAIKDLTSIYNGVPKSYRLVTSGFTYIPSELMYTIRLNLEYQ